MSSQRYMPSVTYGQQRVCRTCWGEGCCDCEHKGIQTLIIISHDMPADPQYGETHQAWDCPGGCPVCKTGYFAEPKEPEETE